MLKILLHGLIGDEFAELSFILELIRPILASNHLPCTSNDLQSLQNPFTIFLGDLKGLKNPSSLFQLVSPFFSQMYSIKKHSFTPNLTILSYFFIFLIFLKWFPRH
jgi:hypothetical protein